ncbi:ABC transporter permease [Clostridium hydrogenum]|uniref:ABC transporter permease n=1 Tax=Clostridium hydrogenum TaxID=2855764 RepID=UPI001F2AF70C|nr:ABC transporter permease [Clostridium hydrogenum]
MKPLGTGSYLKNNAKKIFPQFICILLSVYFVYLISVIFYSSIYGMNSYGLNIVKNAVTVDVNSKYRLPEDVVTMLKSNSDIGGLIPIVSKTGQFQYNSILTYSDGNVLNVFAEDIKKLLNLFHMKVVKGRLPKGGKKEVILPMNFAKQNKINIGDHLGNNPDLNTSFDDDYKVVGITDGPCSFMVTSSNIKISRNEALRQHIIVPLKNEKQAIVVKKLKNIGEKNITVFDYEDLKEQLASQYKSVNTIKFILDGLIVLVLCISVSHINSVVLLNRKKEFLILNLIGYKKLQIYKKILKESAAIDAIAFVVGVLAAVLTAEILNITLWEPQGEYAVIFKFEYIFTAVLIPVCVFIVNTIVSLKMSRWTFSKV